MTEQLYIRAICPNDIKADQLASRNWANNYEPWYIGNASESELSDEKLDLLFKTWIDEADFDMWDTGNPMSEFEDFTDFLEERGYKCFYTAGNIWMPKEEE